MVSTDRFLLKKTAAKDAAGFTLIEITMALILLGILAAIAVPKYFDMQEQAAAKKCKYNQSVVLSQLYNRYSLATAGVTGEEWDTLAKRGERGNEILAELGGDACYSGGGSCPNLCPDGGHYTVKAPTGLDGNVYFKIQCSVDGHGSQVVGAESFHPALEEMGNQYTKCDAFGNGNCGKHAANGTGVEIIETIGDYFTNRPGGRIDSDAYIDENNNNYSGLDLGCKNGTKCVDDEGNVIQENRATSMAELVNDMLENAGIDTSQVVWKMYRADQWDNSADFNDPNPPAGTGYHCNYIIQVANRPSDDASADSLNNVTLYKYVMTVRYSDTPDERGFKPVLDEGGIVIDSKVTQSQGSLTREESNGQVHYKVN